MAKSKRSTPDVVKAVSGTAAISFGTKIAHDITDEIARVENDTKQYVEKLAAVADILDPGDTPIEAHVTTTHTEPEMKRVLKRRKGARGRPKADEYAMVPA